jgi:hypothetical protein
MSRPTPWARFCWLDAKRSGNFSTAPMAHTTDGTDHYFISLSPFVIDGDGTDAHTDDGTDGDDTDFC